MERIDGQFGASPVYANGYIYLSNKKGKTTVIKTGTVFDKVAENNLENGIMASPAISGQSFVIRTTTHLYRIEK
jgi:hypothetical protein